MIGTNIVAASTSPKNHTLSSMVLTYPRIIHAELLTHRLFSRNAASSRAVPFQKMVEAINTYPFIPIAWQKDHKGMQGSDYVVDPVSKQRRIDQWLYAKDLAVLSATKLYLPLSDYEKEQDNKAFWEDQESITKQICNRILEPFQWYTSLVSSTEWTNFLDLRCPQYKYDTYTTDMNKPDSTRFYKSWKDVCKNETGQERVQLLQRLQCNKGMAEIHLMALAESMHDTLAQSKPKLLKEGDYHIPFEDQIDELKILSLVDNYNVLGDDQAAEVLKAKIQIAIAMAARTSYTVVGVESKEPNYANDIRLCTDLIKNRHLSPPEHVAQVMTSEDYSLFIKGKGQKLPDGTIFHPEENLGWCSNFRGFEQIRYKLEHNNYLF